MDHEPALDNARFEPRRPLQHSADIDLRHAALFHTQFGMRRERKFPAPPERKRGLGGHRQCWMISTALPAALWCVFHGTNHGVVASILVRNSGVVPITSSRDVSDPGTGPGVRVRGPRVGSLTSRLLSGADRSRGERRRAIVNRY